MADPEFGQRMAALRRERGERHNPNPAGRPKIADKYRRQIGVTEKAFADAMPQNAELYVETLADIEPEVCPEHKLILECVECGAQSQRQMYDHKAAAYLFDRIMGKPTARTESTLSASFVDQLTRAFIDAFLEVNDLSDPLARRAAFSQRLAGLRTQSGESAA